MSLDRPAFSAINNDPNNTGEVKADVVYDGSGYRLVIAGTKTGLANDITVSTTITNGAQPFFDAAVSQDAADARLHVFGIDVTRPSSTIDDLIPA